MILLRRVIDSVMVAGATAVLLLLGSVSAFARLQPEPSSAPAPVDGSGAPAPSVTTGSPAWMFVVTALISAAVAIAATLLVARLASTHHVAARRGAPA